MSTTHIVSQISQTVADKLKQVQLRLRAAELAASRPRDSVQLIAVSKQQPIAAIQAALASKQRDFGENYVNEASDKILTLASEIACWHFIGPIQSNKTRAIAEQFDWVHSIDRIKIAQRLSMQRPSTCKPLQVCIQVNISGEANKAGAAPATVVHLAQEIAALPGLQLRGLMCIPAPEQDKQAQRRPFRALKHCLQMLKQHGFDVDTLSMGMSNDLEAAVAEGATMVRIGTAIFGPRASKQA